jgi:hypothetical protein
MGKELYDSYSLLHFSMGVLFYFLGVSLKASVGLHILFEIVENTKGGMKISNTFNSSIGGKLGKPSKDSFINSVTDTLFFGLGWIVASCLDKK